MRHSGTTGPAGRLVASRQARSPRQWVRAGGGYEALRQPVVDVAEAVESPFLVLDDVEEGAPVELHVGEVLEEDVDRLNVGALKLLPTQRGPMHFRELVEVLTDADVLEAHPVDTLVNRRDEFDARDPSPAEDGERLGEHDQGDRTSVPDVLAVRPRMALEQRPLVDVQVPVGDADGEVAECVWRDVDAAGGKTVALHRREGSIVADDVGDRITRRHVAPPPPSYEMHGRTHGPLVRRHNATLAEATVAPRERRNSLTPLN